MLRIAAHGARAQRVPLTGTAVVVALAAALLSLTGVVLQTGAADPARGGLLVTLVSSFSGTALLTVVFAVAATVTLGLRQRRREFALLRAVGATRAQVRRLVGLETSLLTLVAAPLGAAGGLLLTPVLTPLLSGSGVVSEDVRWDVTAWPAAAATALLLPVTLVAARFAVRETLRVAPTAAVRESTVEPRTVGRGRLVTAAVLAGLAVPVAATPLAVSGTQGAAVAAVSAFLLVGAAALAGPWWTERALRRTARLPEALTPTPVRIALANSRGFSRRLAAVVVPLAIALALGVVQTGVGRAVDTAAHDQLTAGIRADLVVTSSAGVAPDRLADLTRTPGVRVAQPAASATLAVQTDDEAPGFLGWEYVGVGTISPTAPTLADPDVTAGSLAALARPDTVAVSADAELDVGGGVGRTVVVRDADGGEHRAAVVAVYDRGLAFGDYLVGPRTLTAWAPGVTADAAYLQVDDGAAGTVTSRLTAAGWDVVTPAAWVERTATAAAGMQHLSDTLLLTLLLFVAVAAADTLVLTTIGRRRETTLLGRLGATRRQLVRVSAVEALVVSTLAWVVGTLAALPGLVGVSVGLSGTPLPSIDLPAYLGLSAAVFALPLLCTLPTVWRQARTRA